MLARIRKDELPDLEKGVDKGWRLFRARSCRAPKMCATWLCSHTRASSSWPKITPARRGKCSPAGPPASAWVCNGNRRRDERKRLVNGGS